MNISHYYCKKEKKNPSFFSENYFNNIPKFKLLLIGEIYISVDFREWLARGRHPPPPSNDMPLRKITDSIVKKMEFPPQNYVMSS